MTTVQKIKVARATQMIENHNGDVQAAMHAVAHSGDDQIDSSQWAAAERAWKKSNRQKNG
jgi:hypothetical protein